MITIEGQASLFLKDLKGKEYPAYAEVRRNKRVNGQRELTVEFLPNIINVDFLQDIEFGWKVIFKGEEYTIITPTYKLDGDKGSVAVDAVLSFFVDLNGYYLQDSVEDKSMTPAAYFSELFNGTPYSYVLVDNLGANTLNYSENQSKTERFLYGIDRFRGEYKIQGKVAYIYDLVGHDKDIILHDDLNVQDATIEVDASGFHTYAKGFGDLDESKENADYELETEWESPLIAKYGKIEGPALYDGSFKHEPALKEAVKKRVENSYKVSTTITPIDLTNNGYPEMQLEEGDRVFLHVDRLNLNQQVRVMEVEETFDVEGNIVSVQYTLGNESIATRYKTQQYNTLKDFGDIIDGRKKIKVTWLEDAVKRASDIINGNLDSHFSYGAGEIIGINRNNPNGYMRFNTDGLGFSRDGGKTYQTAITYEGIVADAVTAGTLRAITIEGVEIYGSKFSTVSEKDRIEIYDGVLTTFQNGVKTSSLTGTNHSFFRDDYRVGNIGTSSWVGDEYYRALSFQLAHNADYLHWGYQSDPNLPNYDTILSWHKTNAKGYKGITLNDLTRVLHNDLIVDKNLTVGPKVVIKSSANAARFGVSDSTYLVVTDDGKVGLQHNGSYTNIIS